MFLACVLHFFLFQNYHLQRCAQCLQPQVDQGVFWLNRWSLNGACNCHQVAGYDNGCLLNHHHHQATTN